jgi:chromate transporter
MDGDEQERQPDEVSYPGFQEAVWYWLRLGCLSFGGPAGQIAMMHRDVVEKRRWISEGHFLHALNFAMLLPGPEAQQLATYLGWRLHGARGGLAAGILFVLPSAILLLVLSWIYMNHGSVGWVAALFSGLLPAVLALVILAVVRIGKRALRTPSLWVVAGLAFFAMALFKVSFVIVLGGAALASWLGHHRWPGQFPLSGGHGKKGAPDDAPVVRLPSVARPTGRRTVLVAVTGLCLWWAPVLVAGLLVDWNSTLFQQGWFFSKAALVTFGGAYAVLPYVAQQAVEVHGWLSHGQMMSGLGLAETTPGPLIMVLQFVGFVGGWQHPGMFTPEVAAVLGAVMTTWVTFVPCFLFIFLGGPYVERLGAMPRVNAALTGITAAVVGVIVQLALWFGWHTLWPGGWMAGSPGGGVRWVSVFLAVASFAAMRWFRWDAWQVVAGCAAAGLGLHLAGW